MRALTGQQEKVLVFVDEYAARHGFPPTLREIGDAVGVANVSAVRGHVAALEKKGYIDREADKARSIRVVRSPSRFSRLKRKLHQLARTDEGILHRIVYGLTLACRKRRQHFVGPAQKWIAEAIERECVERGWDLLQCRVEADHVLLVVGVWPNHSPQLVARRIRAACEAVRRRRRDSFPGRRLLASGFAAITDLSLLDHLVPEFMKDIEPEGRA